MSIRYTKDKIEVLDKQQLSGNVSLNIQNLANNGESLLINGVLVPITANTVMDIESKVGDVFNFITQPSGRNNNQNWHILSQEGIVNIIRDCNPKTCAFVVESLPAVIHISRGEA